MTIELICDNCEKPFHVEDDLAGGKVPCPMCGDVNRVPAAAGPPASAPAAPASPAPEPPKPKLAVPAAAAPAVAAAAAAEGPDGVRDRDLPPEHGPEREICIVRPAMFRAHPFHALLIALLFAVGIVCAYYAFRAELVWLGWTALLPSAVAVIWALKWWVATHWWVKLTISNKRTVRQEGIITRRTSEVLHDHVRNVEISQTFLQRILKTGFIGISSAGQDDIEIQVRDIPNPYRVKEIIDRYRDM